MSPMAAECGAMTNTSGISTAVSARSESAPSTLCHFQTLRGKVARFRRRLGVQERPSSDHRERHVAGRGIGCTAQRNPDFHGRKKGISWLRADWSVAGTRIILYETNAYKRILGRGASRPADLV